MQRLLVVLLICFGLVQTGQAADFATYRATYELTASQIIKNSATEPLDGFINYELRGAECIGYTITQNFSSRYAEGERGIRVVDIIAKTTEGSAGENFVVAQDQQVNGKSVDAFELTATRNLKTISAEIKRGATVTERFDIKPEVLFPTAHQRKLLKLASQGALYDVSQVYDGSGQAKIFDVATFISAKREPNSNVRDQKNPASASFRNQASWVFQLGYYAHGSKQDDEPEFQSTFNMYENGVSTEVLFTYDTYQLKGALKSYDALPPETCKAASP